MKVFIIEDDLLWQSKLKAQAAEMKLTVVGTATTLNECKGLLNTLPDIIIADVHIGNESVFTLFADKELQKISTIFITMSESSYDFDNAKIVENHFFLNKPFTKHTLQSAIDVLNAITKVNANKFIEKSISSHQSKEVYKLLGETQLLKNFNLDDREIKLIQKRWQDNKTFKEIGLEMGFTSENARLLFNRSLGKLRSKIKNANQRYSHYLEFIKIKNSKVDIANTLIREIKNNKNNLVASEIFLVQSIDELKILGTKWKNVLHEKNINTIGDLIKYNKKQLLLLPLFGPFVVSQIELELSQNGLALRAN